ncbi:hypothetical protein [Oceaniglobus roseus]|uniref:hypothetical protein n=1 Tax=Oceaniglobus roseus TaxID=1737570 RepID=UPI000C7EB4FC|nr:hypothetical protein [Kandeliimicrobium roseum]
MAQHATTWSPGAALSALAAFAGAAIAAILYLTPLTGVTGTIGALIVLGASLLVGIGALLLMATRRALWLWLTLLGGIGTAVAAAFLHAWWIVVLLAVVLVGLVMERLTLTRSRKART